MREAGQSGLRRTHGEPGIARRLQGVRVPWPMRRYVERRFIWLERGFEYGP